MASSLLDDLEIIIAEKLPFKPLTNNAAVTFEDKVTDDTTLALLQHTRILQSERANVTIREALNESGATLTKCAQTLASLIQNPHIKAEVRRRAVIDVITLHNANALPIKQEPAPQQISISIQTSDRVNLADILNPNPNREVIVIERDSVCY
jgi:hypothetical protein